MKILRTNHMIQYFLSEPIKMHPKKGEETEMTLLPISRSLSCQTLCFSFGCQEILQMHISEEDQSFGKLLLCGANGELVIR